MLEELEFSYLPGGPDTGEFFRPTGKPIANADVVILQDRTEAARGMHAA
jgi:hypothetical protein